MSAAHVQRRLYNFDIPPSPWSSPAPPPPNRGRTIAGATSGNHGNVLVIVSSGVTVTILLLVCFVVVVYLKKLARARTSHPRVVDAVDDARIEIVTGNLVCVSTDVTPSNSFSFGSREASSSLTVERGDSPSSVLGTISASVVIDTEAVPPSTEVCRPCPLPVTVCAH